MSRVLILILFFQFLFSNNLYALLGRHNFLIDAGLGIDVVNTIPVKKNPIFGFSGTIEIGYLFHSMYPNKTVHGLDLRLGMDFSFPGISGTASQQYTYIVYSCSQTRFFGYTHLTYTVGKQLMNGQRIMFDVLGAGLSFGITKFFAFIEYTKPFSMPQETIIKNNFQNSVRIDIVLPIGTQFMIDEGIYTGFRHILSFGLFIPETVEYQLYLNIGFIIGKI